jgi:hypothetical protein
MLDAAAIAVSPHCPTETHACTTVGAAFTRRSGRVASIGCSVAGARRVARSGSVAASAGRRRAASYRIGRLAGNRVSTLGSHGSGDSDSIRRSSQVSHYNLRSYFFELGKLLGLQALATPPILALTSTCEPGPFSGLHEIDLFVAFLLGFMWLSV